MNAVEVKEFNTWYGKGKILNNIDLSFRNNSITAVIGPSGCGKTTLLRSINRTAELESSFKCQGDIQVFDNPIYQVKDVSIVRRQVGMVYQTPAVLPLSIRENVLFGPRYYGERGRARMDSIVEKQLTRVALWDEVKDRLNRPADILSGGQKQRLAMARVLAIEPQVLLLDEPCSSLDPASTGLIEELLQELAKELSIIIVTHNLYQARRIAKETVFLLDGNLVEKGLTSDIFSSPTDERTRGFVSGLYG